MPVIILKRRFYKTVVRPTIVLCITGILSSGQKNGTENECRGDKNAKMDGIV